MYPALPTLPSHPANGHTSCLWLPPPLKVGGDNDENGDIPRRHVKNSGKPINFNSKSINETPNPVPQIIASTSQSTVIDLLILTTSDLLIIMVFHLATLIAAPCGKGLPHESQLHPPMAVGNFTFQPHEHTVYQVSRQQLAQLCSNSKNWNCKPFA